MRHRRDAQQPFDHPCRRTEDADDPQFPKIRGCLTYDRVRYRMALQAQAIARSVTTWESRTLTAQQVGPCVEVCHELPHSAEVSLLGTLAQTAELEVLVHLLAECGGHDRFH